MNTKFTSLLAFSAAALLSVGAIARADDAPLAPVTNPPAIGAEAPRPERIIYSSQLPSVGQLTQTAQAQGLTVANITQTAAEITVTYRLQDNSTRTISYRLLPVADAQGGAPVAVAPAPSEAPVQVVEIAPPAPTVVYRHYDPYYYDPFYWSRAPISVNLGFGWGHRGGYYGGHHSWGHHHW